MGWSELIRVRGGPVPSGAHAPWLAVGYILLYTFGYLSKPLFGSAAIWPSHALSFTVFVLAPLRLWPLIALGMIACEIAARSGLAWLLYEDRSLAVTLGFAAANVLTTAGPAALARLLKLFQDDDRSRLVISPVWIVVLAVGVLPGSILGATTYALVAGSGSVPADASLWAIAAMLAIVTFAPALFGVVAGFPEEPQVAARSWEGWAVASLILGLFVWLALTPWPGPDGLVEPMLFAVPLVWLALRFSHRATSIAVAIVASCIAILAGRRAGAPLPSTNLTSWQQVVISIDIFLLIGCGGALLINLMTWRQRALLDELAREHAQLSRYAQELDFAEEAARRSTAADLHDGIGQVLAGQSMTLAAMRAQASQPKLAALVEEAIEASREAQEGLRLMIQDLTPPELERASLEETLEWLAGLFGNRFGFTVHCHVTQSAPVEREQLHLVYRCVRELLMNACKHSRQKSADVEVEVSTDSVHIAVIDEGVGFDARGATPGFGLGQLRQRVRSAGGSLDIETAPGEGCRVEVLLPRAEAAAARAKSAASEASAGAARA
ncbi:MAG TPA: ATP-binding protein [Steroidobacteraceae bacterium]|nr:ATP-binding protein [Steroidobacteraceae bacterium]